MAAYPVTLNTLRTRVAKFTYLAARADAELQLALDTAQGDVELSCPAAADGSLSTSLDRSAGAIHADLAVWCLRAETERDENGTMPQTLVSLRRMIDDRLKRLAEASAKCEDVSQILVEAYEATDDVELPA